MKEKLEGMRLKEEMDNENNTLKRARRMQKGSRQDTRTAIEGHLATGTGNQH